MRDWSCWNLLEANAMLQYERKWLNDIQYDSIQFLCICVAHLSPEANNQDCRGIEESAGACLPGCPVRSAALCGATAQHLGYVSAVAGPVRDREWTSACRDAAHLRSPPKQPPPPREFGEPASSPTSFSNGFWHLLAIIISYYIVTRFPFCKKGQHIGGKHTHSS